MRLPINVNDVIELYEKEEGLSVNERTAKLIETTAIFINSCYYYAISNKVDPCILDKEEYVQMVQRMFEEKGDTFSGVHREFFELAIDTAIEAYQQGLSEESQKARAC